MNYSDIEKIRKLFDPLAGNKTLIITSKEQAAMYTGQCTELTKYKIYLLDRSKQTKSVKNEDLVEKIKPKIIETSGLSIEQKLIEIYNELRKFYQAYNINVFVQSGWVTSVAWARFKESENSKYGHDVIIILN